MVNSLKREDLLGYTPKERISLVDGLLIVVMILLLINIFVQSVWLSPVHVDGTSMNNTLEHKDWLYMDKITTPKRGDIIVFKVSENVNYIKRIIALPGDSVKTVNGKVWLKKGENGEWEELNEPYAYYQEGRPLGTYIPFTGEDVPEIKLGDDELFVLGDNRWGSRDSREIGKVKTSAVIGMVPNWAVKYKESYGKYLDFIEKINLFFHGDKSAA